MKLKNKKTGEIVELESLQFDTVDRTYEFDNIAELEREWEDYEDDDLSKIIEWIDKGLEDEILPVSVNDLVEKLKAWKRLKDKGFRFGHWVTVREKKCGKVEFKCDDIRLTFDEAQKIYDDISLLFGGEDE